MIEWILQYWVGISFGILAGALGGLWKQFRAYKNGMITLLRNSIVHYYNTYTARGYIPIYALENVHNAYTAYKQLVKDSAIDKLYNDLLELPTHQEKV